MSSQSFPDIPALRAAQSAFFDAGKTKSISFRIDALRRLESELKNHEAELLEALDSDLGKPELEAYVAEVFFVTSEIRLFCKKLKRWAKPERAGHPFYFWPARSEIRREPFGCSLVIGPWNYPVQLILSPVIASIAAGNCVMMKPSEFAPATSKLLAKIIASAFDPAHVTVVEGAVETSKQLLNQEFDFIFYTGSERVGKIVAQAAAEHLTPTVLELGGKCPCVVREDSDLDIAANRIAAAKFFNAGQTCFAPDFVIAHESICDELAEKIEQCVIDFYKDEPHRDLAAIVNDDNFERLTELLSKCDGIKTVGEDKPDIRHMAPRILPQATWDSPVMADEIFGPILPILSYSDDSGLINKLRELSSPLALYLFTRDLDAADKIADAVQSGAICINDLMKQSTNLNLPFGGVGKSGIGRYRGKFGFDAFTYQRAVTRRYFVKDVFATQPPYGDQLEKMRRFLK